ncbi:hypothetical protein ACKKBF_B14660 [Auxenochlorella protothecoides x Auxenochlorella symbiontica]
MAAGAHLGEAVKLLGVTGAAFIAGKWHQRRRRGQKGVFVLAIQVKFESEADRDIFIDLFRPLAKYVAEHEPQTLSYDLAIADTDPTLVLIHERYATKKDLTEVHHVSEPFLAFKKATQELPFPFVKTGQSYYEQGIGYM